MSEIAEELERLAEELKRLSSEASAQRELTDDTRDKAVHVAVAATYADSAWRLRQRAAELRAQRTGPAYKPQPKPSEVRAGQWWGSLVFVNEPVRLTAVDDQHAHAMLGDGTRLRLDRVRLITDARWLYVGDGEHPET